MGMVGREGVLQCNGGGFHILEAVQALKRAGSPSIAITSLRSISFFLFAVAVDCRNLLLIASTPLL